MGNTGYLCVIFDSDQPDLVKLLKTAGDPQEQVQLLSLARSKELSLIHQEYFDFVDLAEELVRVQLSEKYYPVKPYWDIKAPLNEVISVIKAAKLTFATPVQENETDQNDEEKLMGLDYEELETELIDNLNIDNEDLVFSEDDQDNDEGSGKEFYDLAEKYYYGSDDVFQDYKEAMKLYKKAAKFGCTDAYFSIGLMYSSGEGVRENKTTAKEYYTKGAQSGDIFCMKMLTEIFFEEFDFINWGRCWKKIFLQIEEQKEIFFKIPEQCANFITVFMEQFYTNFLINLENRDPSYLKLMLISKSQILEAYDYSLRLFKLFSNHVMSTEGQNLPLKERTQLLGNMETLFTNSQKDRNNLEGYLNGIHF